MSFAFAQRVQLQPRRRPVDAVEFESIVRSHEIFVSARGDAARIVPRYVVAHGMRCERRHLMDIDFTGADLAGTIFAGADLTRACFHSATLTQCDFRRSILRRANLSRAVLTGAQLGGALLDEADMRATVLAATGSYWDSQGAVPRAGLQGSSLDGARLEGLVAQGVDFSNASLRGAKLCNANLRNADLTGANLDGADLSGASLKGVKMNGAILTGVDVESLNLPPESLTGCVTDSTGAALARAADIRAIVSAAELWIETGGVEGARGRLEGLDIRVAPGAFRNRALGGLSAPRAVAVGVDFSGTQLQGAVFDGADLRRANFQGADLRGASFLGAQMAHADMTMADVGPLKLPDGGMRPTRFDGATLEGTGQPVPQSPREP